MNLPIMGPTLKLMAPANSMYNPYAGGYLSIGICSATTMGWAIWTSDLKEPRIPVRMRSGMYAVNWMNTEKDKR